MLTVTSEIEFQPSTKLVESPLFRLVSGSSVSSPSTMWPFENAGRPLNPTLPLRVRAAYKIVAPARGVYQSARGELERASEVAARFGRFSRACALSVVDVFASSGLRMAASPITRTV